MRKKGFEDLRNEIDVIDGEIVALLGRRMTASAEIGRLKAEQGTEVIDWGREEAILQRLISINAGAMPEETLRAIYREILSGSRALQARHTVAFLGPQGTYTHEAALEKFGHAARYIPCFTVPSIFREVEHGGASFGVVPVENSIEGSVRETLDLLMSSNVAACGEISLQIRHALVSLTGRMEDVRRVVSHPQALAQCRGWLMNRLPGIPVEEASSTALAAQQAAKDEGTAAIASEAAAARLGLQVISKGIQDMEGNITRFLLLGSLRPVPTGRDKTSIVFWTEDKPGALFKILKKFARHDINLSRILSRPDRGDTPWKYAFFVDLDGHRDDPNVAECLKELSTRETLVKIIGSFPVHSLPAG